MSRRSERPHQLKSRSRNPQRTQQQILAAALREFSAKGLAGARVDAIARQAGVNKRMLYHYFGNKLGLFSEVLKQKLAQREALLGSAPTDPAGMLLHWFDAACQDMDWFRLLEWEALQPGLGNLVHEEQRRGIIQHALESICAQQKAGLLPPDLDPQHLLLSMVSLIAYPLAFPQQAKLVTGLAVTDAKFQADRREFLQRYARLLYNQNRTQNEE